MVDESRVTVPEKDCSRLIPDSHDGSTGGKPGVRKKLVKGSP